MVVRGAHGGDSGELECLPSITILVNFLQINCKYKLFRKYLGVGYPVVFKKT